MVLTESMLLSFFCRGISTCVSDTSPVSLWRTKVTLILLNDNVELPCEVFLSFGKASRLSACLLVTYQYIFFLVILNIKYFKNSDVNFHRVPFSVHVLNHLFSWSRMVMAVVVK